LLTVLLASTSGGIVNGMGQMMGDGIVSFLFVMF
jgi:hypothetical protein